MNEQEKKAWDRHVEGEKKMIIMGIDPGIANIGFGLIESTNTSYIVSGCIRTYPRSSQTRRLYSIGIKISRLIEAMNPDVIVIEDFIPFRQRKNMGQISQAYGVIQYVCECSSARVIIVRPNIWMRKLLGLTQTAAFSKLKIQKYVEGTLKVETKIEHEAEALGLALYYMRRKR